MERITEHHLRIIRISIIAFAAISVVGYSYEVGENLYLLRQPNQTNPNNHSSPALNANNTPMSLEKVAKQHHQPYQLLSFITTCLIFVVLANIGLIIGIAKYCNFLLKIWLVQAAALCFLGVYLTILTTFGTYTPKYGRGVGYFFITWAYVIFMVLVWIFHERGSDLETVIRTQPLRNDDAENFIPGFDDH